jgi:hypothetical protein
MWRILVPLNYLKIKHPDKKVFDWFLPVFFCALMSLPLFADEFRSQAFGDFNIVGKTGEFLGILTGFFIAALAAVATFGGQEMNDPMPGSIPVTFMHRRGGVDFEEEMSRRRFLSYLFGYLAFMSLFSYLLGYSFIIFNKFFLLPIYPDAVGTVLIVFWVFYTLVIGNLLSNTLLGLYYLTDRIHRPNGTLVWNSKNSTHGNGGSAKHHVEPAE